VANHIVNVEKD